MSANASAAPLLSRLKFWQLAAFGLSGWCALYSSALLNWDACRNWVGNTQGGCFAMTMTLAGLTTRRYRQGDAKAAGSCLLAETLTTEQINGLLARTLERRGLRVEPCHNREIECGFSVRAINTGRTMVFETVRWQEPVIGLEHAQSTEKNRSSVMADLAIIVGVGAPSEDTQAFVKAHPLRLLLGNDLREMAEAEKREVEMVLAQNSANGPENPSPRKLNQKSAGAGMARLFSWWRRDRAPAARRKTRGR